MYAVSTKTRDSVLRTLSFPDFLGGQDQLGRLVRDFKVARRGCYAFAGCIRDLDGIHIKITQPETHLGAAGFNCRKGSYYVPVEALADVDDGLVLASAMCRPSAHDSIAHSVSYLGRLNAQSKRRP